MFLENKCPHKFLPRDFGTENGFYWQMANSKVGNHLFLLGLASPGLAEVKTERVEHATASVVELSLGDTFSHSLIQLGFIPLGHFGWFFWEEPHQSYIPRMWCGCVLPYAPVVRTGRGLVKSTCVPRSQRHLAHTGTEGHGMSLKWREPQGHLRQSILTSSTQPLGSSYTSRSMKPTQPPVQTVFCFTRSFKSPELFLKQISGRKGVCIAILIWKLPIQVSSPRQDPGCLDLEMLLKLTFWEALPIKYGQRKPLQRVLWGRE